MAGYVAVKLLRQYRQGTKKLDASLATKYKIFTQILERMKADNQPGDPDSVNSYATLWSDMIDRGGLYHINDDTYNLIESLEMVVRHFLNTGQESMVHQLDLFKLVNHKAMQTSCLLMFWERICAGVPSKYEKYQIELLGKIIHLWVKIRGHSFAHTWNLKFETSKYQKGTRKTLLPEKQNES